MSRQTCLINGVHCNWEPCAPCAAKSSHHATEMFVPGFVVKDCMWHSVLKMRISLLSFPYNTSIISVSIIVDCDQRSSKNMFE